MSVLHRARTFVVAPLALGLTSISTISTRALAEIQDYEFQLVNARPKVGEAGIAVQLINKKTGKATSDAVIIAKRIDMQPDGMAGMTAPIEQVTSTEPGVYLFKTSLVMEGGWRLSLAAKVQGETGTVENKLVLKAVQ